MTCLYVIDFKCVLNFGEAQASLPFTAFFSWLKDCLPLVLSASQIAPAVLPIYFCMATSLPLHNCREPIPKKRERVSPLP